MKQQLYVVLVAGNFNDAAKYINESFPQIVPNIIQLQLVGQYCQVVYRAESEAVIPVQPRGFKR